MNPSVTTLTFCQEDLELLFSFAQVTAVRAARLPALIQEQVASQQLEAARQHAEEMSDRVQTAQQAEQACGPPRGIREGMDPEVVTAAAQYGVDLTMREGAMPAQTIPVGLEISPQSPDVTYLKSYAAAKQHLGWAEDCRRKEDGGFRTFPQPGETPDEDYAAAGVLISAAMQHLDESIPNGQIDRTAHAYWALEFGVVQLGVWLRKRGVIA